MLLQGSCHCGAVKFSVQSQHPYPFNRCYCSVCRKTAGAGGFAINLNAESASLNVTGKEHINIYHAIIGGKESNAERHFCRQCGSALWLFDSRWPEQIHPHASAIDTDLPVPPEHTHIMLGSKENWVEPDIKGQDKQFSEYPEESIASWHQRLNLTRTD